MAVGAEPTELPIEVFRNRADDLRGVFTVKVSNTSGRDIRIDTVTLTTGLYGTPGPVPVDASVAPGLRVDLLVPVDEAVCPAPDGTTATVQLVLAYEDAPDQPVTTAREVSDEQLRSWNDRECAVAEVRAAAQPEFVGPWVVGEDDAGRVIADGTLRFVVPDDAPAGVTVTAIERTVLFAPVDPATPVDIGVGQQVDVPIRLATGRCDPHAVGEASARYGFVFPIRISRGAAEAVVVPTTVDPADRGPLFDLITRGCGL